MPVSSEIVAEEPIIIVRIDPPFDPRADLLEAARVTDEAMTTLGVDRIYRIDDVANLSVSFSQAVVAMAAAAEKIPGSTRDPRVQVTLVSSHAMLKLVADSMKQVQYGQASLVLFPTLDEALAYARQQIAEKL